MGKVTYRCTAAGSKRVSNPNLLVKTGAKRGDWLTGVKAARFNVRLLSSPSSYMAWMMDGLF